MDVVEAMLTTSKDNPDFLKKVITGDESWVYSYDIETKLQSSQWKPPEEPFFRIIKNRKARQNTFLSVKNKLTIQNF